MEALEERKRRKDAEAAAARARTKREAAEADAANVRKAAKNEAKRFRAALAAMSEQVQQLQAAAAAGLPARGEHLRAASAISASSMSKTGWPEYQGLTFQGDIAVRTSSSILYACGRPFDAVGDMPAELAFAAFGAFLDWNVDDSRVDDSMFNLAQSLCDAMATAYKIEGARENAALNLLNGSGELGVVTTGHQLATDGESLHRINVLLNLEVKNLYTGAVGDPYMQNSHFLLQRSLSRRGPCPVFLLSIIDHLMYVSAGFMNGDLPTVQPLGAPVLLMATVGSNCGVMAVARFLAALKHALEQLQVWYDTHATKAAAEIVAAQSHAASMAASTSVEGAVPESVVPYVTDFDTGKVSLLERVNSDPPCGIVYRGVFEAFDPPQTCSAVIKFVKRYGLEAHAAAASKKLAPALLASQLLPGGWTVVVMAELCAQRWVPMHQRMVSDPELATAAARRLRRKWERFVGDTNFVHGDMHQHNVMVAAPLRQGTKVRVRVIDWDWSGLEGTVRYPVPLSNEMKWPASSGDVIRRDHDMAFILYACQGLPDTYSPPSSIAARYGGRIMHNTRGAWAVVATATVARKRLRDDTLPAEAITLPSESDVAVDGNVAGDGKRKRPKQGS